jgi:hypothetical protein
MVCKTELKTELERSIAAGEMTERFVMLALEVCDGYFSQHSFSGFPSIAKDEFKFRFLDRLLRDWQKASPHQNLHAFLTGMARFSGLDVSRKFRAEQLKIDRLNNLNGSWSKREVVCPYCGAVRSTTSFTNTKCRVCRRRWWCGMGKNQRSKFEI